jgi:hypothetical protein
MIDWQLAINSGRLTKRQLDRAWVASALNAAVIEKTSYQIVHNILLPVGTLRTVRGKGELTFDAAGNPTHMLGTVQDITEQLQTESELRARSRPGRIQNGGRHIRSAPTVIDSARRPGCWRRCR